MTKNVQVLLASRPRGWVTESDFRIVEQPVPAPREGEVLVKNLFLSLDPYMRGRMNDAKSYAANVALGAVMVGGTVGEVVESRNPAFKPGDIVLGYFGWQQYGVGDGKGLQKVARRNFPLSLYLGTVGMPGVTAWIGLLKLGQPKPKETVVVAAASGAVGSVVGQLAKRQGCRAVGIAGGRAKCDYVVKELGFDACIDYKAGRLAADLEAATPDGIDVYFENVGGAVFRAVLPLLNDFARIPVCGRIAHYNDTALPEGPDRLPQFMGMVLTKRLSVRGFIQFDHLDLMPDFRRDMAAWIREGKVRYREDIVEGLENTVEAFRGLLTGRNRGKLIVQVSDDPT
jgi:NADPH-dependent curcumin reductase CurA